MRVPRLTMAWGMILIVAFAANFALIRHAFVFDGLRTPSRFAAWGVILMANVLAFAIRRLAVHPRSRRPFLAGFVVHGLLAVVLYLAFVWRFPEAAYSYHISSLVPIRTLSQKVIRALQPIFRDEFRRDSLYGSVTLAIISTLQLVLGSALIALPQFLIALTGGLLSACVARITASNGGGIGYTTGIPSRLDPKGD